MVTIPFYNYDYNYKLQLRRRSRLPLEAVSERISQILFFSAGAENPVIHLSDQPEA